MRARFCRRLRDLATRVTSLYGECECSLGERGSGSGVDKRVEESSR